MHVAIAGRPGCCCGVICVVGRPQWCTMCNTVWLCPACASAASAATQAGTSVNAAPHTTTAHLLRCAMHARCGACGRGWPVGMSGSVKSPTAVEAGQACALSEAYMSCFSGLGPRSRASLFPEALVSGLQEALHHVLPDSLCAVWPAASHCWVLHRRLGCAISPPGLMLQCVWWLHQGAWAAGVCGQQAAARP